MPVLVDDDIAAWVPGGAAASTATIGGTNRVLVLDELVDGDLWARSGAPLNADLVLTLTYDPILSRVRITGTSMDVFSLAAVERSTNLVSWTTVRGGAADTVSGGVLTLDDYEFTPNVVNYYRIRTLVPFSQIEIGSITPTITAVWLKSVARPFLNLTVTLLGYTFSYERDGRGGIFDVVGRSLPVAVTDVRGSRRYTLQARTDTDEALAALELLFASGDVLLLQAAPGYVVPAGGVFVAVGRVVVDNPFPAYAMRFTTFDLAEVAAPGPDVVGATSTWQTVLNTYATWNDVLAAKADWSSLLEIVGTGSDVIVP